MWVAKEASLVIQKVAKADYEAANPVMNLAIQQMKLSRGYGFGNSAL